MSCFPCFSKEEEGKEDSDSDPHRKAKRVDNNNEYAKLNNSSSTKINGGSGNSQVITFTFRELATATKNFRADFLLGEGSFGRVYKGCFESTGQVVAVKQLDRNGLQENNEFAAKVETFSFLHHPNLVHLIGYCAHGEQRLLVFEFMPLGSLDSHLFDLSSDKKPLDWYTRMKIAFGVAQGLEYLHKANPLVIYCDLKSSSILLDEGYYPKLSDFGLAKLGLGGDKSNIAPCVMDTYGYCAPEYAKDGELSLKSDVYSFGVVLLELISGRRVIDTIRPTNEQNLIAWAQPMFRDQKRFPELVDQLLKGAFPTIGLNQAVGIAAMCLQEEAMVRPLMADIVMALSYLIEGPPLSEVASVPPPIINPPLPEERPRYHSPELASVVAEGRNRSSSSSRKFPSSKTSSSKHVQAGRQASLSSSSAHSEGSSHSRSSSMHSVNSEDSSHEYGRYSPDHASANPTSNSPSMADHHECEEQYLLLHIESDTEKPHQATARSSSSSSGNEASEQMIDIL
ncbi:hypothetical protein HPP92_006219 [Vanilla planifolia]|uniref:Protein kinase domain-containing protein n=1 Tax=Vanilla planifolia TaxID=51239 RepID=A0A835RVF9_VANPL|nr:hypothetical protein HPP92_006219 [Vanilla planifolia]